MFFLCALCVSVREGVFMFSNIKDRLDNSTVRQIMTACVYDYSPHVADKKLDEYRTRETYSMYGWIENGEIIGICGFQVYQTNRVEVMHIAVDEKMRQRGIGSAMVKALQEQFCLPLKAETDDDAVGFYRKAGFETTAFHIGGVRRYICVLAPPFAPKPIEDLDPSKVVISFMPKISAEQLWDFYVRNDICETGYGKEAAVKPLQNKHDYVVAAFHGDTLVGFIRMCSCGHIQEACLELTLQGDNLKHDNGSLIEKDKHGIFKQMGNLLMDKLAGLDIDFVSMYIVEDLEETSFESIGMELNGGHKVYIKDMRAYTYDACN